MNRTLMIEKMESVPEWDITIIGGGATGLGIALDAASRGLKTILFEKHDFAKGTSSRSTKLVHGGVRYLQQGNIKLVMEALKERGLLLKNAPHLVHNLQFVIPNYKWWEKPFYGIGLKIYDKMAGKLGLGPSLFLTASETLQHAPTLDPEGLKGGVIYHDGQFDDARLAISIAQTAAHHGATLLNYFQVNALLKLNKKTCGVWVKDQFSGKEYEVRSRQVINATGVFTDHLMKMDDPAHEALITCSQGIHLVVEKSFLPGNTAIMIPRTDDGRVLFAVPWHDKIVLGTTDTAVSQVVEEPIPFDHEIDFVINHMSRYLARDLKRSDIKSCFAGLRPLLKRSSKKTAALPRDHFLHQSESGLITITGGKWTTYRKMAEDTVNLVIENTGMTASGCITENLVMVDALMEEKEGSPSAYSERRFQTIAAMDQIEVKKKIHPELPYLRGEIIVAVREEMCMTVEDALSRRTRALLLDARAAIEAAPAVAGIMAREMDKDENWINNEIDNFKKLAANYLVREYLH